MCTLKGKKRGNSIISFLIPSQKWTKSSMDKVNKEDKLLGRGANPITGKISPTQKSILSARSHQQETRPEVNLVSRHQQDKATKDQVHHNTPPTPPNSTPSTLHEGTQGQHTQPSPKKMLVPRKPVPGQPQAKSEAKKTETAVRAETSSLLVHYNAVKCLLQSRWVRRRPIAILECVLRMLHHIIKTFVVPDGNGEGNVATGILERNTPNDLLLCFFYIVLLFLGFKVFIQCIINAAHFVQVFARVV